MSEELKCSRLVVTNGDDQARVVIEGGVVRIEGPGKGVCIVGLDPDDGTAGLVLGSQDGQRTVRTFADARVVGLSIRDGDCESTLQPGGLSTDTDAAEAAESESQTAA